MKGQYRMPCHLSCRPTDNHVVTPSNACRKPVRLTGTDPALAWHKLVLPEKGLDNKIYFLPRVPWSGWRLGKRHDVVPFFFFLSPGCTGWGRVMQGRGADKWCSEMSCSNYTGRVNCRRKLAPEPTIRGRDFRTKGSAGSNFEKSALEVSRSQLIGQREQDCPRMACTSKKGFLSMVVG